MTSPRAEASGNTTTSVRRASAATRAPAQTIVRVKLAPGSTCAGFGLLRVINDDSVQPSKGFGTHSHANMEIISVPLAGSLCHKDSMGNTQIIKHGEVQVMSAGTGVSHSEFNDSSVEVVSFLQIWVLPKIQNIEE